MKDRIPDHAAFIERPDEGARLVAVADLQFAELGDPPAQVRAGIGQW